MAKGFFSRLVAAVAKQQQQAAAVEESRGRSGLMTFILIAGGASVGCLLLFVLFTFSKSDGINRIRRISSLQKIGEAIRQSDGLKKMRRRISLREIGQAISDGLKKMRRRISLRKIGEAIDDFCDKVESSMDVRGQLLVKMFSFVSIALIVVTILSFLTVTKFSSQLGKSFRGPLACGFLASCCFFGALELLERRRSGRYPFAPGGSGPLRWWASSSTPARGPRAVGASPTANMQSLGRLPEFPERQLGYQVEHFALHKVVGEGAWGKVCLASPRFDLPGVGAGRGYCAIKMMKRADLDEHEMTERARTEREIMEGLPAHPFVIRLYAAFEDAERLYFAMEYCLGGDLFYHLDLRKSFPEPTVRFYCAQLALALGHLHAHGVCYRDLKTENLMLDARGYLKVIDFGLSKPGVHSATAGAKTVCGTPSYLAPETLMRKGYGHAADWWALGILAFELRVGLPPWHEEADDKRRLFRHICLEPVKLPLEVDVSLTFRTFLAAILKKNPAQRLGARGAAEVQAHKLFAGVPWDRLRAAALPAPITPKLDPLDLTCNFPEEFTRIPVRSEDRVSTPGGSMVLNGEVVENMFRDKLANLQESRRNSEVFKSDNSLLKSTFGLSFQDSDRAPSPPPPTRQSTTTGQGGGGGGAEADAAAGGGGHARRASRRDSGVFQGDLLAHFDTAHSEKLHRLKERRHSSRLLDHSEDLKGLLDLGAASPASSGSKPPTPKSGKDNLFKAIFGGHKDGQTGQKPQYKRATAAY